MHFKALGTLVTVLGAVIGHILTTGLTKLFVVDFETNGTPGDQKVLECKDEKGGVKKHTLASKTNAGEEIDAAEAITAGLLQFAENEELMDK